MQFSNPVIDKKLKLINKYRNHIEGAYNYREIDSAKSDLLEFKALKTLNKLNKLNFLQLEARVSLLN